MIDTSQTRAIAYAINHVSLIHMDGNTCMEDLVKKVEMDIEKNGLDILALKNLTTLQNPEYLN